MNQCCLIFLTLFFSFSLCDFFEYNILVGTNGSQGGLQGLQGISVSMSSDGNILAVGGSGDNFSIGATWVFMRNGNNWTQQGDKLVGSGYEVNATFKLAYQGAAVSVSGDGNTLAVGGTGDNGGIGATWIFVRNGSNWTQQGDKLVGSGYNGTSHQGQSVSLSSDGNTLAVGGPINGNLTGAAWIFVRNGSNWTQQGDKLVGSGYNGTSNQGRSVSLSGDGNTLAVGGFSDNKSTGATWIFVRNGTDWTQQGDKLVGSEGNNLTLQGRSVSLSGDGNTLAIGGNGDNSIIGATWIFVRKNNNWTQQGNKLVGSRYIANVSWSGTYQGWSVSLSGDGNTLAVGGYGDNALIGATWIFVRNGTNWTQQGDKLVGSKGSFQQGQGTSVSLNGNGDTLAVGGPNNNVNKGATWIFLAALRTDSPTTTPTHSPTNTPTYSPTSPTSVPTISPTIAPTTTPSNTPTTTPTNIPTISPTNSPTNYPTNTPTSQSPFFENNILVGTNGDGAGLKQGTSVSFNSDGNILAVGGDQDAWGIGATWIFVRNGNNWTQQGDKLVGSGYNGTSKQGFSVSLSGDGNTLAVGGPFDANFTGATWVFVRNGNNWSQQGDKLVGSGYNGTSRQGHSVSLSSDGNTLAVGGHFDNVRVGATWIFVRNGNNWTQQGDKLVGSGHTVLPQQGFSVGLSSDGNTLAIGGFGNGVSDNGGIGATWIFVRKENNWTQQGDKLVGSGYNGTSSTNQGQSVSLSSDGNTLAVGGHCDNNRVGAIWIFVRNENNWTQQGNKLVGSGYIANETTFQGFSVSLSSDGNTLAVGGPGYNNSNGATWIFMRNGINWIQQGDKLVGSRSVGPFTSQGTSVCLNGNGDTLAIGGPSNGNNGTTWIFLATPSIPTTPTHSPTNTPTNIPTNIPTLSPTNIPTNIPTTSPTNIPTLSPTNTPTNIPTLSPTNIPTITPTNTPTQSPIQTCPSNYTLIGKECIPCIGDWIPQPISGSVHLFCSDCKNGRIILARKVINSPNCPDTNADNVKCEPCNFPCQLDDITQIDVDKNKTQVINQIKNLLEAQDYFDGLVGVVSDNETDSDVTIRDNSLFFGFYPCLETTNMTNYKVLVKSLMDDIFKTKMVVTNVTSYHYPICQVELNFEKKESTDFKMILIYSSSISVPVLIVIIVILIIYQRYLSSKLHKLPDEISWSFLLKLRRPFRWSYTGTEDNGYYYCYFTKGSDEWNRVTRYFLRNHLDSKMRLLDIESIIAVYNPTLTSSFINKWFGFMKRIESSAFRQSFMDKTSSKETKEIERINTTNSLKDKTYKEYLKLVSKFEWNHNDCQVPIISVLHATDYSKASFISLTGFACLSSIDSGYYGKGIYFTSSFFYSIPYLLKNSDPAIIISYVLPGNVYPVIEKPFGDNKQKNNNSFLGKTLKNGFDSHYVITAIDGYPATTTNLSANVNNIVYDELVIVQEHQIVPAFILRFSHPTIKPFFMKYKQDLYSYQRTTSQVEEEEEFHLHEKGGEKIFQNEREKEIFNYDASTNFKDNINEEDESEFLIKLEDDNFGSYNSRFKQVNKNNTFNMSSKGTVSEELMTLVSIGEEI